MILFSKPVSKLYRVIHSPAATGQDSFVQRSTDSRWIGISQATLYHQLPNNGQNIQGGVRMFTSSRWLGSFLLRTVSQIMEWKWNDIYVSQPNSATFTCIVEQTIGYTTALSGGWQNSRRPKD
ncbi:hypothetical protein TNCT_500131 [Trichonephila clavata]|uniref:Uncharacterized protein n=1 Tax=Trichonephila clavata TaxID=2740835 RepID=A0A8X6G4A9_TRICU|nr:hypothetical protein TNCT_500131 [Trichonephila clavata]